MVGGGVTTNFGGVDVVPLITQNCFLLSGVYAGIIFSSPFSLSWIYRKSKTQLFLTFQWRGAMMGLPDLEPSYLFGDSEVATKFYKWKDMWWCHVSRFFSQKSPSSDWKRIENHPKRGFTMKLWKPGWRSTPTLLLICSDHSGKLLSMSHLLITEHSPDTGCIHSNQTPKFHKLPASFNLRIFRLPGTDSFGWPFGISAHGR